MTRRRAASVAVLTVHAVASTACARPRPPALWFEQGQEQTQASIDVSKASRVSLVGRVARVTIVPGEGDSVRLSLALRSTDTKRLREKCIPGARLEQQLLDGTLSLQLRQSGREQCGETWHVTLPPRLAVALEFSHAEIDASGIGGGLTVRVSGTGRVTATVDSAPATVTMGVGDVHVVARRAAVGELFVESEVGRAELTLHGVRVPGVERAGPSSTISTRGNGHHDYRVRTRVGNVSLVVN